MQLIRLQRLIMLLQMAKSYIRLFVLQSSIKTELRLLAAALVCFRLEILHMAVALYLTGMTEMPIMVQEQRQMKIRIRLLTR